MFNLFISLFVSVEGSGAYVHVLSIIAFFSINFSAVKMLTNIESNTAKYLLLIIIITIVVVIIIIILTLVT
jgi:hypothetical protein